MNNQKRLEEVKVGKLLFEFSISAIIGMLIGIGTATKVSIRLGQYDKEGAEKLLGNAQRKFMFLKNHISFKFLKIK